MKAQKRKVLLLIDNTPSHIFDKKAYPHLCIEFLPPNMTSHIQPMDAGIIRAFKAHYRRLFVLQALDRKAARLDDLYKINQLQAMAMIKKAWDKISQCTISNCWKHAGILPRATTENPILQDAGAEHAEKDLQSAMHWAHILILLSEIS